MLREKGGLQSVKRVFRECKSVWEKYCEGWLRSGIARVCEKFYEDVLVYGLEEKYVLTQNIRRSSRRVWSVHTSHIVVFMGGTTGG